MRRIAVLIALGLLAAAVAVPAGAQTAPSCNGLPATQEPGAVLYGTEGPDVLVGTEGADRIYAEGGDDTICALGGDDIVAPGFGDEYVDGGGGNDTLLFTELVEGTGATVDLSTGTATGPEGADQLIVGSIENVEMNCSSTTDDTLIGDDDANILSGGSGSDIIQGRDGDDVLYGTDPSYGRTDAICWNGDDDDTIDGGPGDDILWGQAAMDSLDGGPGWDILDGGAEIDGCANGERYSECETEDPVAPPAECDDGTDNDGDGDVDGDDSGCSHPGDPSELIRDDPGCNDGIDNDDDGRVDFPEDRGCMRLEDETELDHCIGPCPPAYLTIEYKPVRKLFRGKLDFFVDACAEQRRVLLRKKRSDGDRTIGRDRTNYQAIWKVSRKRPPRGRFYAVARRAVVVMEGGEQVECARVRSPIMKIQT